MKKIMFAAIAALTALTACQKSEISVPLAESDVLYAAIEDVNTTKTYMDADNNIRWCEGDQVVAFLETSFGLKYQIRNEYVGSNSGYFSQVSSESSGDIGAGTELKHNIVYYPYSSTVRCEKSGPHYNLAVVLPSEQTYVAESFGNGSMAMVAVSEDNNISFKNVLGGMKLQLKGTQKIKSITLQGKNNEKLSGKATVTAYTDGTKPAITMDSGASTSITLKCGSGVQLNESAVTEFIIALPPVVFSKGFVVTITDSDAKVYTIETDRANSVIRSSLLIMPINEVPTGEEPADYDIDGKQWCFAWNALGGAPCVIDFGVTQPGTAIIAYDFSYINPSYASLYYPYIISEYAVTKTDGTSGVVALSADGITVEIPYSNATENSVHFATAALLEEDVDCTLATSPIVIYKESAQYWIIADGKVATPLTGYNGYLNVVDAVDGRSTAANAFTFTQVDAGLYTIQDANGKFYYQTGSYNSFNVADEDGMTDEFLWEVYDTGNGQFAITNYGVGKYIQYNTQYNSYGSYMDERGILPTLVLAENPIVEPETGYTNDGEY